MIYCCQNLSNSLASRLTAFATDIWLDQTSSIGFRIKVDEKTVNRTNMGLSSMADRWVVFVILEFVSAGLGFAWGIYTRSLLFLFIGGFFFSLGVFAATRLGFDRWKAKKKPKKRGKKG